MFIIKKQNFIGTIFSIIVIIFIIMFFMLNNNDTNILNDYIALFHGGTGEVTYATYIYKIDNSYAHYKFRYINTTNLIKSWKNTERKIKITKKWKIYSS